MIIATIATAQVILNRRSLLDLLSNLMLYESLERSGAQVFVI